MRAKRIAALMGSAVVALNALGCAQVAVPAAVPAATEESAEAQAEEPAAEEEEAADWPTVSIEATTFGYMASEPSIEKHLNEYLRSIDAGVLVDIVQVDWGDLNNILTLLLTDSDNPLDLFCWRFYSTIDGCVKNDQVISLEPYRDQYPEIFGMFDEPIMQTQQVGGVQYALPAVDSFCNFEMYMMRRDVAEEIGVAERDGERISFDELNEIMYKAKEAHPEFAYIIETRNESVQGIDSFGNGAWLGVLLNRGVGENTIVNYYETEEWLNYIKQCRKWMEDGIILNDPLNIMLDMSQYTGNMAAGTYIGGYSQDYVRSLTSDQQPSVYFQLNDLVGNTASVLGGWCVSSQSRHPDAAMKLLSLLYTDENVLRYFSLGVEGEDYVIDEKGVARYPEGVDVTNAGWNMTCQWFWPNQCLSIPFEKEMENFFTDMWDAPKKAAFSNAMGFIFDSAPVFDQMAACNAVVEEYRLALLYGQFEDVEGANAKFVEELKAAGIDEVIAEEQRQFDAFLAARDGE